MNKTFLIVFCGLVFTVGALRADTLFMFDGQILNGTVIDSSGKSIRFLSHNNKKITIKKESIRLIKRGGLLSDDQTQTPVGDHSEKSRVGACVLSLVYPGLGQFYIGQPGRGVVYALLGTAGVGAVIFGARGSGDAAIAIAGASVCGAARLVSAVTAALDADSRNGRYVSLARIDF